MEWVQAMVYIHSL